MFPTHEYPFFRWQQCVRKRLVSPWAVRFFYEVNPSLPVSRIRDSIADSLGSCQVVRDNLFQVLRDEAAFSSNNRRLRPSACSMRPSDQRTVHGVAHGPADTSRPAAGPR